MEKKLKAQILQMEIGIEMFNKWCRTNYWNNCYRPGTNFIATLVDIYRDKPGQSTL